MEMYACKCAAGWSGTHCETDVRECASHPCQNGAACLDSTLRSDVKSDAYSCACTVGYTNGNCTYTPISNYTKKCAVKLGGNCDIDVNECASNPCKNGATCSDSTGTGSKVQVNKFQCACAAGYANGMCAGTFLWAYRAQCHVETGGTCNVDVNECSSSPCKNGATCSDSTTNSSLPINKYSCKCKAGYANGVCGYSFISQYSAKCGVTTGGNCNVDVDECVSKPCTHGSTCSQSTNNLQVPAHAYSCACAAGFMNGTCNYAYVKTKEITGNCTVKLGGDCAADVDECASKPCKNGAKCVESSVDKNVPHNKFSCQCVAGYANGDCKYKYMVQYARACHVSTGGVCDVDADECVSSPCKNGAQCSDSSTNGTALAHRFRCTCAAGYANGYCAYTPIAQYASKCNVTEGGTCDIDVDECASSPCKNGATCSDSTKSLSIPKHAFSCSCAAGYTNGVCKYQYVMQYALNCSVSVGGRCDKDVDECVSSPCANSAACAESSKNSSVAANKFSCACTDGYANGNCTYTPISQYAKNCKLTTGARCDQDVNECISSPCKNGAKCIESSMDLSVSVGAYACVCTAGYANGRCAASAPGDSCAHQRYKYLTCKCLLSY